MSIQWLDLKNEFKLDFQKGINSEPIFLKLWQLASHDTDLP